AIPYHRYAGYLKFLTFVLFVYVAVAFSVDVAWRTVLASIFRPSLPLGRDEILMVVAVFGTTISPYLFLWQASEEAEEVRLDAKRKERKKSKARSDDLRCHLPHT